ncbi:MAG: YihY/virulence factor BrkB family protein [Notoacmeibacter sp.]|nr:YihY/virulence factor BrkB family protein [Notoacmeibacter sp.]
MRRIIAVKRVVADALGHFSKDDGWAMASHVALSTLMALFPFLIFATALAVFMGANAFADSAVHIIFDTWPDTIAEPLSREVRSVLTTQRGDLLTIGVVLALFFASNGVEALRTSLNRAYRQVDTRSIVRLRLQSFGFVVAATIVLVVTSLLLVGVPVVVRYVAVRVPVVWEVYNRLDSLRLFVAASVLLTGLICAHLWLPCGRRRILDVLPGVALTFFAWIAGSAIFTAYLNNFANYASTYAGLASIIIALVFLYIVAALFIIGAELNAAIMRYREIRAQVGAVARASQEPHQSS